MKTIMVLLMSLTVSASAMAQEKMAADSESWQGFIVDARYAVETSRDPASIMQKASDYTKERALKEGPGAGFGIITKGQWLKFDDEGNVQAFGIIQNTKRGKGFFVKVLGKVEGDRILVTSIEESKPSSPSLYN